MQRDGSQRIALELLRTQSSGIVARSRATNQSAQLATSVPVIAGDRIRQRALGSTTCRPFTCLLKPGGVNLLVLQRSGADACHTREDVHAIRRI